MTARRRDVETLAVRAMARLAEHRERRRNYVRVQECAGCGGPLEAEQLPRVLGVLRTTLTT